MKNVSIIVLILSVLLTSTSVLVSAGGVYTQHLNSTTQNSSSATIYNLTTNNLTIGTGDTGFGTFRDKSIYFDTQNDAKITYENDKKSFVFTRMEPYAWFYPGYDATVMIFANESNSNYGTAVGLQIYVQPGNSGAASELYGFWGGVTDSGLSDGCTNNAVGLFAYNALQGTHARTYNALYALRAFNEVSGATNLALISAIGGAFTSQDGVGSGSVTTTAIDVWAQTPVGAATTSTGVQIDDITNGGTGGSFSIRTNAGNATFNEGGAAQTDFRVEGDTEQNMIYLDSKAAVANSDTLYLGGTTNGVNITKGGNVAFLGSAGFYPRSLNQAAIPASGTGSTQIDVGELVLWRNSGTGVVSIVFNDVTTGVKSVVLV